MKFVHIADMHFDTPFRILSDRANLGEIRRLDQRKAFKKIIEYQPVQWRKNFCSLPEVLRRI